MTCKLIFFPPWLLPENVIRPLNCFQQFPAVEDLVMVKVRAVEDLAAYVNLVEYDQADGMVLLSELSRRRIRSIAKLIRVGREEVCLCIRVDSAKG